MKQHRCSLSEEKSQPVLKILIKLTGNFPPIAYYMPRVSCGFVLPEIELMGECECTV
jgi:hypothetical protein